MYLAETVTFGGGILDRLAQARSDKGGLVETRKSANARHIPFWRGRLLVDKDGHLALLDHDCELLEFSREDPVFLGKTGGSHYFAHDVSDWNPDSETEELPAGSFDTERTCVDFIPGGPEFCELRSVMAKLGHLDAELAVTAKAILGWHKSHGFCAYCGAASRVELAGWRRDCIECNRQHFPRTDPVVIMLITKGNSVLLGRSKEWPEGMYSLLAGFVEPGETIESAVRREVFEEAGIRVGAVGYLASQPWPYPSSLMIGCRGEAINEEIVLDQDELDDAIWITREEMLEVVSGNHELIRAPRPGAIAGFVLEHWLKDRLD